MFEYSVVFPCNAQTKRPLTPHGFKDASGDPQTISEWRDAHPQCIWGYPTGDQVFVIDVDKRSGGIESWTALTDRYGQPNTYTVETMNGGRHFYFAMPTGTVVRNSAGKFAKGIDIRGEGGYVIAPLDTDKYHVINDVEPALPPEWIMFRLRIDVAKAAVAQTYTLPETINEGERNDTLFKYGCSLQARGKSDEQIIEALNKANENNCVSPIADDEMEVILEQVLRYEKGVARFEATMDGVSEAGKSATPEDYRRAIVAMGYTFKRNEADNAVYVNGHALDEYDEYELLFHLGNLGYTSADKARIAYHLEAKNNDFHPVRDYLNVLKWDGQDHIGKLASYFEDNENVFELYLRKWLVGCVAKVLPYTRGVQNRTLVLVGGQGMGKSYLPRWLCKDIPQYHIEGSIRPDDKDHHIRKMSRWIWEVPELGATTRRADLEALKDFLSNENVTVRRAYGRQDIVKPPMANFLATVNPDGLGFLNDPTGSRRYMVCTINRINQDYSKHIEPRQIWAQAVALLNSGFDWNLTRDEAGIAAEINAVYEVESPMHQYISRFFDIDKTEMEWVMPTNEIVRVMKKQEIKDSERAIQMEVSKVLTKVGLFKKRMKLEGYSNPVMCFYGIKTKAEYKDLDGIMGDIYRR